MMYINAGLDGAGIISTVFEALGREQPDLARDRRA